MRLAAAVVGVLVSAAFSADAQVVSSEEAAAQKIAATVCASCHGADGNSRQSSVPKLAGLTELYLVKQMKDYIDGKRKNDTATPCGPDLRPADVAGLAAWFSHQKPAPGQAGDPALSAEGKNIYEQGNPAAGLSDCLQCHNERGNGIGRYPRIAGQHAPYMLKQLKAFKTRARSNDQQQAMRDETEHITEHEMRAVIEYLKGL